MYDVIKDTWTRGTCRYDGDMAVIDIGDRIHVSLPKHSTLQELCQIFQQEAKIVIYGFITYPARRKSKGEKIRIATCDYDQQLCHSDTYLIFSLNGKELVQLKMAPYSFSVQDMFQYKAPWVGQRYQPILTFNQLFGLTTIIDTIDRREVVHKFQAAFEFLYFWHKYMEDIGMSREYLEILKDVLRDTSTVLTPEGYTRYLDILHQGVTLCMKLIALDVL
jgi:hypothetical protein